MTNRQYAFICARIGVLASLLMAVFWGIWSLFAPVPDHGVLQITEKLIFTVPLSRWWDVLFACALVNVYGWSLRALRLASKDHCSFDDFAAGLAAGLVAGLAAGLAAGLVAGLAAGLAASLAVGLAALTRLLFSSALWSRLGNYLAARDKS